MRIEIDLSEDELKNEIWKIIPTFVKYEASNFGRIRRRGKTSALSQRLTKNGYAAASLSQDAHLYVRLTHVLVAEAFLGPKELDTYVRHADGNKLNNNVNNLQYVSAVSYAGTRAKNLGAQARIVQRRDLIDGMWHIIDNLALLAISDSRESLLVDLNRMKDEALRDAFLGQSVVYAFEETAFVVYEGAAPVRVVSLVYKPKPFVSDLTSETNEAETTAVEEIEFDDA